MRDLLATILSCVEADAPRLSAAEVSTWPTVDRECWQRQGILIQSELPASIPCPGCGDHAAVVHVAVDEDDHIQRYVMCPESGRVVVDDDELCQWSIDAAQFARRLGEVLELRGSFRELVPQRLWRLGGVIWENVQRTVYVGVGLNQPDATGVLNALGPGGSAVVFVPGTVPTRDRWPGLAPAVVSLREALQVTSGRWVLDVPTVLASIRETDQLNKATREGLIADPKFRKVVGAIAATSKRAPTDDEILDALAECDGNQHKAAERLEDQGKPIHPGTISKRLSKMRLEQEAQDRGSAGDRARASFSKASTGKRRNNKKM